MSIQNSTYKRGYRGWYPLFFTKRNFSTGINKPTSLIGVGSFLYFFIKQMFCIVFLFDKHYTLCNV